MKIIRLEELEGKSLTQYDSKMVMRKILMTEQPVHVGIVDLEISGVIGFHEATVPQVLVVIEGEGIVRTGMDDGERVEAGEAVFWQKGEWHETATKYGMRGIIIESEGLNLSSLIGNIK